MGKDLFGKELGRGFNQRKDGRYCYRYQLDGKSKCFYSSDLCYLKGLKESGFSSKFKSDYYLKSVDNSIQKNSSNTEKKISSVLPDVQYVYFVSDGDFVKIGVTHNVVLRMKQMQTGNSRELKLIKSIETHAPYLIENALHELLKTRRVNGEWYDILDIIGEKKGNKYER